MEIKVLRGYEKLGAVIQRAIDQAQRGKGVERHSAGEDFDKQVICEVTERLRNSPVAFPLGQAVKKIYETVNLTPKAAVHDLYGAINYIAAAIIVMEKQELEAEKRAEIEKIKLELESKVSLQ